MFPQHVSRTVFKGSRVTLNWLDPELLPTIPAVSAVMVVPFTPAGDVVTVRLRRGVEFPGGTVEPGETLEQTAHRETWEEARVHVGDLTLAHLIRMDNDDHPADPFYVAVYAARVTELPPFVREAESLDRIVMTRHTYVNATRNFGSAAHRARVLADAHAALHHYAAA